MGKRAVFVFCILVSLSFINALDLQVTSSPVQNSFITEFNDPAIFDITIKNNGASTNLRIYSAVGVDITPSNEFFIQKGETKTLRINAIPLDSLKQTKGALIFEYILQDSLGGTKVEKLGINIISLVDAFSIQVKDLNSKSEQADIIIKNIIMKDINQAFIKMNSPFFKYETNLSLKSNEDKDIQIPLNLDTIKTLSAGQYILSTQIFLNNKSGQKETVFKFLEEDNIQESRSDNGFLIRKTQILRKNTGNVKKIVSVQIEKNLLSSLFTSINVLSTKSQINGFEKQYLWEKELAPNEELNIIIKTNWLYPILAIILIVILVILVKRYRETDLILKKSVYYVNTRGGEFALRVHLKVKAKKFIERINIIDKIPNLVTLYDKFGAIAPDKIDLTNKRLEWNVETLNPGEERIFSYIIYSKIGVIGKFELPAAKAIYEKDRELKNTLSNKSFFINRPHHKQI